MRKFARGLMAIAEYLIDIARDWKRIAAQAPTPEWRRRDLWRTHVSLCMLPSGDGPGEASVMSYRVSFLDRKNLAHLFREIFIAGVYDVPLPSSAQRIIDCGSNIGMSILYFKTRYPGARILGFEPHPTVFAALERNVRTNGLTDVRIRQAALSDKPGTVEFFLHEGGEGALNMGMFGFPGEAKSLTVEAETLSSHLEEETDLLKLDIEGAETSVLEDLASHGLLRRIRRIVCEYHHHLSAADDSLSRILSILEQAGFGYQVAAHQARPFREAVYQDVVIYAYRKDVPP
ncbi:MAG: FkbM family methyltransferase [Rhodocyclaceae bacterium]|nr:FkbM family methyltransferase [Rhodocyclaceae bacterium]